MLLDTLVSLTTHAVLAAESATVTQAALAVASQPERGVLVNLGLFTVTLTGWKVIGWLGALCFAGRWIVQVIYRKRTGSNRIPTTFWVMSVVGSLMTLCYFIWGKNDSVGILQNALPSTIAIYNLWLDLKMKWYPETASEPAKSN
jgi:lipid-A-disaccharide synthase-like uncharacterized protein